MHPFHQAAEFAIHGCHHEHNHHVNIQVLTHQLGDVLPDMRRDYNSLIGFSLHMPLRNTDVMVTLLPHKHQSLSTNLGIKVPFFINGVVSG
jgi:hypothetical protein